MMVAETIYNGKVLHTDYYMTREQWENRFKRKVRKYTRRKVRTITRKVKSFFSAVLFIGAILSIYTLFGVVIEML